MWESFTKYGRDYSDEYIKSFVRDIRRRTLRNDLRRHRRAMRRLEVGKPMRNASIEMLPEIREWVARLEYLIDVENHK